jgi:3-methyladenine DNA glycosylase AlkC
VSSLLKDIYSEDFYHQLGISLEKTIPGYDHQQFLKLIFSDAFESMELKQRMTHTIDTIAGFLSGDFAEGASQICTLIDNLKQADTHEQSFEFMFLPEFIETRGIDHFEISIQAFEFITQFTSCEFAVRPFIHRYGQPMLDQMLIWTRHEHAMVRRLASEGSRPRLPWAMAIPSLKQDPAPLVPILEALKQDSSESVRRSVSNNLNDISKDNPEFVISLVKSWQGLSTETDAVIKHACRTLLKQGEPRVMALFGYDSRGIEINDFTLGTANVEFGSSLEFSFAIMNKAEKARKIRIEYAIYHLKKNGDLTRKVFKISERDVEPNSITKIGKKHAIKPITTRKYYAGRHAVAVIINGIESNPIDFKLEIKLDLH